MKRLVVGVVILALLFVLNPTIDEHRETFKASIDKAMDKEYNEANLFEKLGLKIAGDIMKNTFLGSLDRKNFVIFSLGHIDGELVTFGMLGYVHVFE